MRMDSFAMNNETAIKQLQTLRKPNTRDQFLNSLFRIDMLNPRILKNGVCHVLSKSILQQMSRKKIYTWTILFQIRSIQDSGSINVRNGKEFPQEHCDPGFPRQFQSFVKLAEPVLGNPKNPKNESQKERTITRYLRIALRTGNPDCITSYSSPSSRQFKRAYRYS